MSKESEIEFLNQRKIAADICLMLSGYPVDFTLRVLEITKSLINSQSTLNPSKEDLDGNFKKMIEWAEREYKFTYSPE